MPDDNRDPFVEASAEMERKLKAYTDAVRSNERARVDHDLARDAERAALRAFHEAQDEYAEQFHLTRVANQPRSGQ